MKTNKKMLGILTLGMVLLAHTVMASVAGSILTLDGDAWLLATDP